MSSDEEKKIPAHLFPFAKNNRPKWVDKIVEVQDPVISKLITDELKQKSQMLLLPKKQVAIKTGLTIARLTQLEKGNYIKPKVNIAGRQTKYGEDQLEDVVKANALYEARAREKISQKLMKNGGKQVTIDSLHYNRMKAAVIASGQGSVSQLLVNIIDNYFSKEKVHLNLLIDADAFAGLMTQGEDLVKTLNNIGRLMLKSSKEKTSKTE